MQTLCIVQSSGAKLKGGGELSLQDLWRLKSDDDESNTPDMPSWAATTLETRKRILQDLKENKR